MPAPGGKDFLQAHNCQAVVDSAHHVILAVRATKVRAIYQQLSPAEVHGQLDRAVEQLREPFPQVAELLADAAPDILAFTAFPVAHWQKLWSNNPQERLNREIRRRTDVVGIFPNRLSARRLVGAVLAEQHDEWAEARRYLTIPNAAGNEALPEPNMLDAAARSTSKGMTSFYTYLYVAVAPWIGQAAGWTRGGASFTCG